MNYDDPEYQPKPATQPTNHKCGSAEKIEIMRIRLEMGESLWHPDDTIVKLDLTQYEIQKMAQASLRIIKMGIKRKSIDHSKYDS